MTSSGAGCPAARAADWSVDVRVGGLRLIPDVTREEDDAANPFALNQVEQLRGWRLIRKADDEELPNLLVKRHPGCQVVHCLFPLHHFVADTLLSLLCHDVVMPIEHSPARQVNAPPTALAP